MDNRFFEHPILNSPYAYPLRHWELDDQRQPTQRILESRRNAEFITPIPKPRKRESSAGSTAARLGRRKGNFNQGAAVRDTSTINELRFQVDKWRHAPNPNDWQVTPETARLLQHWRQHQFSAIRPCFCQITLWPAYAVGHHQSSKSEHDWAAQDRRNVESASSDRGERAPRSDKPLHVEFESRRERDPDWRVAEPSTSRP